MNRDVSSDELLAAHRRMKGGSNMGDTTATQPTFGRYAEIPLETMSAHKRQSFSDEELTDLTFAIVTSDCWNRLAIAFPIRPAFYQLGMLD